MKILITGHKGFIGSTLWKKLESLEVELYGLEKDYVSIPAKLRVLPFDFVIHLGAVARTAECNKIFDAHNYNVKTTLDILKHLTFKRLIYISSCAVYGSHGSVITEESSLKVPSVYAAQKLYSEQLCNFFGQINNIPIVSLRLFNVYGIGQRQDGAYPNVIASMLRSAKRDGVVQVTGDGTQTRDFVHVDDVVNAITTIINTEEWPELGGSYNVSTQMGYDMNFVADQIAQTYEVPVQHIDSRPFDMYQQISSFKKIKNDFGWEPQKYFRQELQKVIDYDHK
jgi:UDP-glucose 4-epimerase